VAAHRRGCHDILPYAFATYLKNDSEGSADRYMIKLARAIKQVRTWGAKGVIDYLRRVSHDLQVRRCLIRNARQNRGTVPEHGITVIAPMSSSTSLSKAMRDFVIRLREAGIPHQVFDCGRPDGRVAISDYANLLTPAGDFDINRYTTTVEMLTSPLPADLARNRARIAFWEGESGILDVFPYLVDSETVIAMSDYNAAYFRRALPTRVRVSKVVYPLPPVPTDPTPRDAVRARYGIGREDFVVFFNFDLHALYRKNPEGLIRAFATAFADVPPARLVFKVNHAKNYPDRLASLRTLAASLKMDVQLTVIDGYLPMNDIYGLTAAADVYASLHRSEGFGLGIAEAMQYGVPVVVADNSATREFCNAEDALLVPCRTVPITDTSYVGAMKEFSEPDEAAAAVALRRLYDDRAIARKLGFRGKSFIVEHFSLDRFRASVVDLIGD